MLHFPKLPLKQNLKQSPFNSYLNKKIERITCQAKPKFEGRTNKWAIFINWILGYGFYLRFLLIIVCSLRCPRTKTGWWSAFREWLVGARRRSPQLCAISSPTPQLYTRTSTSCSPTMLATREYPASTISTGRYRRPWTWTRCAVTSRGFWVG